MSAFELPADDAPASEWGRLAVLIPDWRNPDERRFHLPDPDHWAWEGWLFGLLGQNASYMECKVRPSGEVVWRSRGGTPADIGWLPLGRACIAYAAANGRWPGGGE